MFLNKNDTVSWSKIWVRQAHNETLPVTDQRRRDKEGRDQTEDIASVKQLGEFYDLETLNVPGNLLWR